jgi:hypothetical protein
MTLDWLSQLHGPGYVWTPPLDAPATESEIAALQAYSPRPLPEDYVAFLRRHGGGEIWYQDVWLVRVIPPADVPSYQEGYGFAKGMPEALIFGGDGGGEGLVFDMRAHHLVGHYPILAVNYVTIGWKETLHVADSFRELLLLRHELLEGARHVE